MHMMMQHGAKIEERNLPLLSRMLDRLLLVSSLLFWVGCSKITLLRTEELRTVSQEVKGVHGQVAELQKSIDDLNINQGGLTSKMKADLTSTLGELAGQITRLQAQIDETQYRLTQLSTKIDKLDQRKIIVSGVANSATPIPGNTSANTANLNTTAASEAPVKVVEGLDLENVYNQAREDYVRGKYELAFQGFKTVFDKDAGGSYKDNTLYWMGECYLKSDKLDKASEMYQRVIKEFPKGNKVCSARFKIGLIYDQKKDKAKRNEEWKALIAECPTSNEAQRAQELIKE